ncbi:MAG: ABC transporter ATP-binding protein, partial [Alphaproteobacteria bacterium]
MAKVRYEKVVKKFGDNLVIPPFDLEIADKEFLVLVGPSGCGKSTLLRLLAGLEETTEGVITIDDRPVNDLPPKDRDIAMVFQNYALYPHMNVYRNMAFGLKMRKFKKDDIDRQVREAARILEIEPLLERKPAQLSGGQRQRVAMGRAIVRQPKVFLFDEPLSNLDAKLRVQMRLEIRQLHRRIATTVVYVTHDQVEAMTLADRIAVIHEGRLQQVAAPTEVYDRPANRFVAGFIGSPAMNFVPAKITDENGRRWLTAETFRLPAPTQIQPPTGESVTIGIRPEHIALHSTDAENEVTVAAQAELL